MSSRLDRLSDGDSETFRNDEYFESWAAHEHKRLKRMLESVLNYNTGRIDSAASNGLVLSWNSDSEASLDESDQDVEDGGDGTSDDQDAEEKIQLQRLREMDEGQRVQESSSAPPAAAAAHGDTDDEDDIGTGEAARQKRRGYRNGAAADDGDSAAPRTRDSKSHPESASPRRTTARTRTKDVRKEANAFSTTRRKKRQIPVLDSDSDFE